jgi:uncharacterized short protein YbdD (DUF466 family)
MNTQHASDALTARRGPARDRLFETARRIKRASLQLFGIPDYERYLEHRAVHHPGEPVMSRRAFSAAAIDRKYCRNGPRCC